MTKPIQQSVPGCQEEEWEDEWEEEGMKAFSLLQSLTKLEIVPPSPSRSVSEDVFLLKKQMNFKSL